MAKEEYVLELKNIRKEFVGTVALKDISFNLKKGEVLGLVGENGAGKSVLIKICTGAEVPTKGEIIIDGVSYKKMTPKKAAINGISVVYQDLNSVKEMSVAENIFLGQAICKGICIDTKSMEKQTKKVFDFLDIKINPKTLMKELTIGQRQMVEIAKAIRQEAKVLIMDEPSAFLDEKEEKKLFSIIKKLKSKGVSVIYISHRMEEIFEITDRVLIIRDGEYITTLETKNTDRSEVIHYMVGREMKEIFPKDDRCMSDEVLLSIQNLSGIGIKNINFDVHRGEIVGIGGLVGAGRTKICALIFGMASKDAGKIIFKDKEIQPSSPKEAINEGITLLPEDRIHLGGIMARSVKENINIPIYQKNAKILGMIDEKSEYNTAQIYKEKLHIKTPTVLETLESMSGGNQQKIILSRCIAANSELFMFDEPTAGVDIGAKYEIYKLMNKLVNSGKAIIMISSDIEELIGMSDKIIVLAEGVQTGVLKKEEFSQEKIMELATTKMGEMKNE